MEAHILNERAKDVLAVELKLDNIDAVGKWLGSTKWYTTNHDRYHKIFVSFTFRDRESIEAEVGEFLCKGSHNTMWAMTREDLNKQYISIGKQEV